MEAIIQDFRAGDSLNFSVEISEYPPSAGWSLAFSLRGPASIDISTTTNNGAYVFNTASSVTATYVAGTYDAFAVFSNGSQQATVPYEQVNILPSLTSLGATPYDTRTHAQITLANLKTMMEGKASEDVQEYTIGNRSLKKMTPTELLNFLKYYEMRVAKEQREADKLAGRLANNTILVQF